MSSATTKTDIEDPAEEAGALRKAMRQIVGRRMVANRCAVNMYTSITGNTGGANFWSGHKTPKNCGSVSDLELTFSNYLGGTHPEANGTSTFTLKVAIEYPTNSGKYYPVWFGGARTVTIEPGAVVRSSPVGISIPEDSYFQVHCLVIGAAWSEALMPTRSAQREGRQTTSSSTDRTETDVGMTFSNSQPCFVPNSIVGNMEKPVRSFIIYGDSITAGLYDSTPAEHVGFVTIARDNHAGWCQTAQASIMAAQFGNISGSMWRRLQVATLGATDFIDALGQNDVANGAVYTLAQLQASKIYIWREMQRRGIRGWATTITPKCTSSDSWATQAGISPDARQGPGGTRVALNGWIRDGAPMVNGAAVAVGTVGALRAGDEGHPLHGWFEIADLVEVNSAGVFTRDTGIWKLSYLYTADGLGVHPNTAGSTAMAVGIDVPRMLAD